MDATTKSTSKRKTSSTAEEGEFSSKRGKTGSGLGKGGAKRHAKKTSSGKRKKYDASAPKRGSLKRMLKMALNVRITQKALNAVGNFAYNLTLVLVKDAYIYATHQKRVTILERDVEAAAKRLGISTSGLSGERGLLSLGDLEKCVKYPSQFKSGKTYRSQMEEEIEQVKATKRKVSTKSSEVTANIKRPIDEISQQLYNLLHVSWDDLGCVSLQKAAFKKFVEYIQHSLGQDTAEGKNTRWAEKALGLLQLIVERHILIIATHATAVSVGEGKETVGARHVYTAGMGHTSKRIRVD